MIDICIILERLVADLSSVATLSIVAFEAMRFHRRSARTRARQRRIMNISVDRRHYDTRAIQTKKAA